MSQGKLQHGVIAFEVEFGGDVGPVMFDGADTDKEKLGNLATGFVFRNELQHPTLGLGERFDSDF